MIELCHRCKLTNSAITWHQSQHLPCWCRRGCSGCRLMRTSIAQTRFMKARWVDSDLAKEKWELGIFWNQLSLYYHLNDWISKFSSQSSYLPVQFGLDILGVGGAPCISAPPRWCPQEVPGESAWIPDGWGQGRAVTFVITSLQPQATHFSYHFIP